MQALLTVDLGYGDSGKGEIVDYLSRLTGAGLVVRYNGGCQAGHNVVTDDGIHHCFSQFGSGTFAGASTYLSRYMAVSPDTFVKEDEALQKLGYKPFVYVDEDCLITTPFHRAANRLREFLRSGNRHGSCGLGVGETMADAANGHSITVGDFISNDGVKMSTLMDHLAYMNNLQLGKFSSTHPNHPEYDFLVDPPWDDIYEFYSKFARRIWVVGKWWLKNWFEQTPHERVIFEGAQGVLLDPRFGQMPYCTYSNCNLDNAEKLLKFINYQGDVVKIGVKRAYDTRHGAGPFPTETDEIGPFVGEHNKKDEWQGNLRLGHFNMDQFKYALFCCPVDTLAITCLDHINDPWQYWNGVEYIKGDPIIKTIEEQNRLEVRIRSYGTGMEHKVLTDDPLNSWLKL